MPFFRYSFKILIKIRAQIGFPWSPKAFEIREVCSYLPSAVISEGMGAFISRSGTPQVQSKIGGAEVTKSNVGGTVKFYEVGSVGSVGSEGMGAFISRSWILQVKSKIVKRKNP